MEPDVSYFCTLMFSSVYMLDLMDCASIQCRSFRRPLCEDTVRDCIVRSVCAPCDVTPELFVGKNLLLPHV